MCATLRRNDKTYCFRPHNNQRPSAVGVGYCERSARTNLELARIQHHYSAVYFRQVQRDRIACRDEKLVTDTTAENLWAKPIADATFSLYLYDTNKVRIGEGYITLSNVGSGQTIRFQTTIGASGSPVSISLAARSLPPELGPMAPAKKVSLTINSVPQGATFKVDGTEVGETPKIVQLTVGKHKIEFSKEGFNAGTFPVEIDLLNSILCFPT